MDSFCSLLLKEPIQIVLCALVLCIFSVHCTPLYIMLSKNIISDTALTEILSHVSKPKLPRNQIIPIPPPPPESNHEHDSPPFRNCTEKAFEPMLEVGPRLWEFIGGIPAQKKTIGMTAQLAAKYLLHHEDSQVKALLEEAKSIARDCLAEIGVTGRYFKPHIVRELQLVLNLDGRVGVDLGGETHWGTLLDFSCLDFCWIRDAPFEDHQYVLTIYLDKPVDDDLPTIYYPISSREWFMGAAGIRFPKQDALMDGGPTRGTSTSSRAAGSEMDLVMIGQERRS
ncbi:hypothetical protein K469DRAFT_695270 [Zopfia rhizophila CBS 207.26]|uniref:Uncharacterized protein n=1 Tax=Zopfia rhizophila CBS 207.26 TaxID=1314779 RepID=A0A6A6DH08_9PEZI|nr:hypothetical protein K469DRAFT_695270 [Zopfia rhizophila CBS 207.26]